MSRMRLIDADSINFEEVFGGKSDFAKDLREAAQELIDRQPTAFNKEKVIDQLNRCRVYQFQGMLPDGRVCHFSDVVEIVEKGGIE